MVEWSIARQVSRLAAGSEPPADLGMDLVAVGRELEGPVIAHTALQPAKPIPAVEVVSRAAWASANLDTFAGMIDPVAEKFGRRLGPAGSLGVPMRLAAGSAVAAEMGVVTGFLSRHVLGQYELSLLVPDPDPRLLLVGANLDAAYKAMDVDRESFVRWVTVHELVHAVQFGGVPWLREHLGGLMREYMGTLDLEVEKPKTRRGGGLLNLPDPRRLAARYREGGVAALVQSGDQRALIDQIQATMAVIEGHAEHVMDALAPEVVPEHEGLRAAMERKRGSGALPQRVLMKLLGMELKMRQYREGKAFCDAVAAEGGIATLNRVWAEPAALPTLDELAAPQRWLARTAAAA